MPVTQSLPDGPFTTGAGTPAADMADVVAFLGEKGTATDAELAPAARQVTAGTGLTGGGDLSADRTLAVTYGTTAGTAAQGNDSRLSDARTPTAHTHTASQVSDSTRRAGPS